MAQTDAYLGSCLGPTRAFFFGAVLHRDRSSGRTTGTRTLPPLGRYPSVSVLDVQSAMAVSEQVLLGEGEGCLGCTISFLCSGPEESAENPIHYQPRDAPRVMDDCSERRTHDVDDLSQGHSDKLVSGNPTLLLFSNTTWFLRSGPRFGKFWSGPAAVYLIADSCSSSRSGMFDADQVF